MALQMTVDALDAVPEALRDSYVARDGKFHLAVDGFVPKDRLDEFRNNNVAYKREIEALNAKFADVDVDVYKQLTEKEAKLRDKKLIDAGKVDELIAERVAAMKAENDKIVGGLTAREAAATKRLEALLVDDKLKDEAVKAGVAPTAIRDFMSRGREVYRLHEGQAMAFDGDKPIYGKDGEPLKMSEWASGLVQEAPHMFPPSVGGGSTNSIVGGGAAGGKTMTRSAWSALPPLEQATIIRGGTTLTD